MDGVFGVSFFGIDLGEMFIYVFMFNYVGIYWYYSYLGMQEVVGFYGLLVIDLDGLDLVGYDCEYVLVLFDWSLIYLYVQFCKFKFMGGYFNWQKQMFEGLLRGKDQLLKDWLEWVKMWMDFIDIFDVIGLIYSFLINGYGMFENWIGLFVLGEWV